MTAGFFFLVHRSADSFGPGPRPRAVSLHRGFIKPFRAKVSRRRIRRAKRRSCCTSRVTTEVKTRFAIRTTIAWI